MTFYERCESLAKQKGLSFNEIADKIGLSGAATTGWKKGVFPKADTAIKLAKLLGTTVEYLVEGTDSSFTLSAEEMEILQTYRKIPKAYIRMVKRVIKDFSEADDYGESFTTASFDEE